MSPGLSPLGSIRPQQHLVAVKIQEPLLPAGEAAGIQGCDRVNAHAPQGRMMRDWRDDEQAIVFEADEPAIKEMIDTRCEEQSVLPIEPFFIGRAMACSGSLQDG